MDYESLLGRQKTTPKQSSGGLKGIISSITQPFTETASNVAKTIAGVGATSGLKSNTESMLKLNKERSSYLKSLSDADFDKPEVKAKLQDYTDRVNALSGKGQEISKSQAVQEFQAIDPVKAAANAADVALTIGSLGAGALAKTGAKVGTKALLGQAIKTGLKEGAIYGGAYGALNPLKEKGTAATGEDVLGNTLSSAVTGGLMGGAVGGGINLIGKGTNLVSKMTNRNKIPLTTDAERLALAQEAKSGIANLGKKAKASGTSLLSADLNVTPKESVKFNLRNTADDLYKNYGMTVKEAADYTPIVTGGEGITTEAFNTALENTKNVSFKNFASNLRKQLDDPEFVATHDLTAAQIKNFKSTIQKYDDRINPASTKALTSGKTYNINASTNAKDAFDVVKDLERKGYSNINSPSQSKAAIADLQLKMADDIKSSIYNSSEGKAAFGEIKKYAADTLDNIAQQSGNAKLAKVADSIRNAATYEEYRKISAPFVNAQQLVDASLSKNASDVGIGITGTLMKGAKKTLGPTAGRVLSTTGNIISEAVRTPQRATLLSSMLNKAQGDGVLGTAVRQTVGRQAATQPTEQEITQSSITPTTETPTETSTDVSNIFGNKQVIQALLMQDIQKTGGKNTSSIIALYNAFKPSEPTSAESGIKQVSALVSNLKGLYDKAGGGSTGGPIGVIGGELSSFAGNIGLNDATKVYNDERKGAVTVLAKNLFSQSGSLSDTDIARAEGLLPSISDPKDVAAQKWDSIDKLLIAKRGY
jgi:hypothetical protein